MPGPVHEDVCTFIIVSLSHWILRMRNIADKSCTGN